MSLNRWSSRKVTTPIYFYVPRGVKNLAVVTSAGKAAVPVVLDSGGKRVASAQQADDGKLLLFPVAAGQDGKVWSINQVMKPRGFDFQLLNAPNTFSLSPDSLLVPEDALQ